MRRQNHANAMLEARDPWLASDVVPSFPHKHAAQDTVNSGGGDVVRREDLRLSARLRYHPILRQHRHNAHEESCQPEGVEDGMVVHVAMQDGPEDEGDDNRIAFESSGLMDPYCSYDTYNI